MSIQANGEPMLEAMNAMGYDAMGIGAYELLQGLDVFAARRAEANFPFVSANLLTRDGTLLAEPYIIVERGGIKVGIIGITEPDGEIFMRTSGLTGMLKTRDAADTLAEYIPLVRAKADIIVVLSRLGLDRDRTIAGEVPGIDVIIGSNARTLMEKPERVGDTIIVQQGYQGEWLGRTEIAYDEGWKIVTAETLSIALTPDYPDDPELAEIARRWNELFATPTPEP